jgi:peptide deformylase
LFHLAFNIVFRVSGFLMGISSVMAMNIVTIEQTEHHQVLKTPAISVQFPLNYEDDELIKSMKTKLQELGGVGLAAPQVNYSRQIIAIYIPEEAVLLREGARVYPMHIMINPTYSPASDARMVFDFEGCYSVSNKAGKVPRYDAINLTYFDESGTCHQSVEHGFYARVIQHEIDHLNGMLIVDRLTPECVQGSIQEMMVLRRAELSEEKRTLFDEMMAIKLKK